MQGKRLGGDTPLCVARASGGAKWPGCLGAQKRADSEMPEIRDYGAESQLFGVISSMERVRRRCAVVHGCKGSGGNCRNTAGVANRGRT